MNAPHEQDPVRTRFAPSPTGQLHAGNARAAVVNWLIARHFGGDFVLRIEDTDTERNVVGAERAILDDLRWLGLDWDEGPEPFQAEAGGGGAQRRGGRGPHAPYRQSERLELYDEAARRLLEDERAYPCYCTPRELESKRRRALERGEPPAYDGACRRLDAAARSRLGEEGRTPALRFAVDEGDAVVVRDAVRGEVAFDRGELGDFVIVKSDGLPTYNFAVVVDDALMRISHVIRGVGHLSNTPRQILLQNSLGYPRPVYAHIPTVLGPDRQKLSKRHGATSLAEYRARGLHPDALVNYLSLLSWSSPSGDEVLERSRLVREISLDRFRSGDVVFDEEKLRWLSGKHIESMALDELASAVLRHVAADRLPVEPEVLPVALEAVRSHLATFSDAADALERFTAEPDPEVVSAALADGAAGTVLAAARRQLDAVEPWAEETVAAAVRAAGREVGARGPALYHPLRIALTGATEGPPLAAFVTVLGRAETRRRLDRAGADRAGADTSGAGGGETGGG